MTFDSKEISSAADNPLLRLTEIRVPEGTKDVTGRAFRYAFISTCDGEGFVEARHLTALLAENKRLRESLGWLIEQAEHVYIGACAKPDINIHRAAKALRDPMEVARAALDGETDQ